ncbi:MAG: hypothetical protein KGN76_09710 [Acidobacteriota bacterium]|nr:hypothetical protein [Acidobacteriota bacterium]
MAATDSSPDPGLDLVTRLPRRMQLDERWMIRRPRGFTWWGHTLAQRVWLDAVEDYHGTPIARLHVETDVLRGVPDEAAAIAALVPLNRAASLSSLAVDADGRIRLHASIAVTPDNATLAGSLAQHALAIQAADAHIKAAPLAAHLGAQVARSAHPSHGPRAEPDDLLDAIAFYADKGAGPSPFADVDFRAVALMQPRPWVLARTTGDGLEAELPFLGSKPSILDGTGAAAPETALLQVQTSVRHAQLGAGLLLRLALPVRTGVGVANQLNLAETVRPEGHQLGAWTIDQQNLACYTFVPAVAFAEGLVETLIWHVAARALWARGQVFPATPPAR